MRIGFQYEYGVNSSKENEKVVQRACEEEVRKSLVRVRFEERDYCLTYYNDEFDVHEGDVVYVDGKLWGTPGKVLDVRYDFRIRPRDFQKIIKVIRPMTRGSFVNWSMYTVTTDESVMMPKLARDLLYPPVLEREEEEREDTHVKGEGNSSFYPREDGFPTTEETLAKGIEYVKKGYINYISYDHGKVTAYAVGRLFHEIEFTYEEGKVENITCTCYDFDHCKHEVASVVLLEAILDFLQEEWKVEFETSGYFAALLEKDFRFLMGNKGKICL